MTFASPSRDGKRPIRLLPSLILASGLGLLAHSAAFAAAPPANATLGTQATATFKDFSGVESFEVKSNSVNVQVQQVGGYSITDGLTKAAAAGGTVYMPYTLTNDGNGTDAFTITVSETSGAPNFESIQVFLDSGNGTPGGAPDLCTVTTAGDPCTVTVSALTANSTYKFVVAYKIGATATWNSNTASVTVAPAAGTSWLSTYPQHSNNPEASTTRTDTVNRTTGAAFTVSKAIAAPAGGVGSGWPVVTSGTGNNETTYTLSYQNVGGAAGTLYIKDILPADVTYVPGSAYISCSPSVALGDGAGDDTSRGTCNAGLEFEYNATDKAIYAAIPGVAANQPAQTLSFRVTVNSNAAIGALNNIAYFDADGDCVTGTIAGCLPTSTLLTGLDATNAATFTVLANRSVRLNAADDTPNSGTPAAAGDAVTSDKVIVGGSVVQSHEIRNLGNAPDTFKLPTPALGSFPAGTVFTWLDENGITPLGDSDNDGVQDTGVLATNTTRAVKLRITIPDGVAPGTHNYSTVVTAVSTNDSNIKDATTVGITRVFGGYVDLTVNGPTLGSGTTLTVSPVTTTDAAVAGSTHQILLNVYNEHTAAVTYDLLASASSTFQGGLQPGWAVTFSTATCGDSGRTPTTTLEVGAGGTEAIYACVTSPVNASTNTYSVYFRATSQGSITPPGSVVSDAIHVAVSVTAATAYSYQMTGGGERSVTKGNSVFYSHVLSNTGNGTCGSGAGDLTVSVTGLASGWTSVVYLDVNNNGLLDSGETALANNVLAAELAQGNSLHFLVRIYAPSNANNGNSTPFTVTVTDGATPGCGSVDTTGTVTVVEGVVSVEKHQQKLAANGPADCPALPAVGSGSWTQANLPAAPGECVYYRVVVTNVGSAVVKDLSLTDLAPDSTVLMETTPAPVCEANTGFSTSGTLGVSFSGTSQRSVICGTGSDSNDLNPGGTVTLRFAVQINE